jgi:hypothetical protein
MIVRQSRELICKLFWGNSREGGADGWGSRFPWSENPDPHPMDEDLSMGSPDPGHPAFLLILCLGDQGYASD